MSAGAERGAPFHVLIPARLASSRLRNKPLADICGQPMIVRVAERVRLSRAISCVVATDDEQILAACRAAGTGGCGFEQQLEATLKGAKPNTGTHDKGTIEALIARHTPELQACYEAVLGANPKVAGSVAILVALVDQGPVTALLMLGGVIVGGLRIRKHQAAPARKAPTQAADDGRPLSDMDDDIPF